MWTTVNLIAILGAGMILIMGLVVLALLLIMRREPLPDKTLTAKKGTKKHGWIIFCVVLVCELAAGYYFNYLNGMGL